MSKILGRYLDIFAYDFQWGEFELLSNPTIPCQTGSWYFFCKQITKYEQILNTIWSTINKANIVRFAKSSIISLSESHSCFKNKKKSYKITNNLTIAVKCLSAVFKEIKWNILRNLLIFWAVRPKFREYSPPFRHYQTTYRNGVNIIGLFLPTNLSKLLQTFVKFATTKLLIFRPT